MPITTPGIREIQGLPIRNILPSATITPHEGFGGGIPSPRKLNDDSVNIAVEILRVITTIRELRIFGTMWTNNTLGEVAPNAFADSM